MMACEHIISDERIRHINRKAYEAGKSGKEVYTQVGADGGEIIRCKDCKYEDETLRFSDGEYGAGCDLVPFCDKLRRETTPDGFCSWAVRCDVG